MSYQIKHKEKTISFEVVFRKRKTMEIRVMSLGEVRVTVPEGIPESVFLERVRDKAAWILRKLEKVQSATPRKEHTFLPGDEFLYLGKEYELQVVVSKAQDPKVTLADGKITITTGTPGVDEVKRLLSKWYGQKAMELITKRIDHYLPVTGVKPRVIKLSKAKKRWGSCTSQGNVLINWRLVMAPLNILDYVIVHELCHLVHMNHSKEYWDLVENILPDYEERRDWLRRNTHLLTL